MWLLKRVPETLSRILNLVWGLMWLSKSSPDLDTSYQNDSITFSKVFEKENGNFLMVNL